MYRDETHFGEHEPILDRDLFAAVQAKLAASAVLRQLRLKGSPAILAGRIFDDRGNRMSPTHANKLAVAAVLATVIASPALAQSFDPHIGSGNLSPTVESGGFYLPPVPSGVCEVRRVQFSDAFGWRVRDVLVCCTQGRCTSRLTY
jgi:hypothetical protein